MAAEEAERVRNRKLVEEARGERELAERRWRWEQEKAAARLAAAAESVKRDEVDANRRIAQARPPRPPRRTTATLTASPSRASVV